MAGHTNGRLTQKDLLDLFDKRIKPLEEAEFQERIRRERTYFLRWFGRIFIGAIIVALGTFLVNQLSVTGGLRDTIETQEDTISSQKAEITRLHEVLEGEEVAHKDLELEIRLLRRFIIREGFEPPSSEGGGSGAFVSDDPDDGNNKKNGNDKEKGNHDEPPKEEPGPIEDCLMDIVDCLGNL